MNLAKPRLWRIFIFAAAALSSQLACADAVTDWNTKAGEVVREARLPAPFTNRVMAQVQTAVYEATNAITQRYTSHALQPLAAPKGASIDAAIAVANHVVLSKLLPTQQATIESAYKAAMATLAEGDAKAAGISVGEKAAAAVLAARADDGAATRESYRPATSPGVYVPTVVPAVSQWPQRKPWLMSSASQFRPGAPPGLGSALWARDYNEVKALGSRSSTQRNAEQTEMARFWEDTSPPLYHSVVRSVANMSGREITQNARLFMAVTQATDDAAIAIYDAKYHYNLWRPITAIRNGDMDGNDATERDATWLPLIDTPMHPEYPCAHCVTAGAVGAILKAELGATPAPTMTSTSLTAKGVVRSWTSVEDFMHEVAIARIYGGVHYRNSTEVGTAIGKQAGELAVAKYLLTGK